MINESSRERVVRVVNATIEEHSYHRHRELLALCPEPKCVLLDEIARLRLLVKSLGA